MSPLPQDGHLQDKTSPSLGLIQEETEVINSIMGNGISYSHFFEVLDGVSQHALRQRAYGYKYHFMCVPSLVLLLLYFTLFYNISTIYLLYFCSYN